MDGRMDGGGEGGLEVVAVGATCPLQGLLLVIR